jgi:outer membrane protein TolC
VSFGQSSTDPIENPTTLPPAASKTDQLEPTPRQQPSLEDLEKRLRDRVKDSKSPVTDEMRQRAMEKSQLRTDGVASPARADIATDKGSIPKTESSQIKPAVREALPTPESDALSLGQKLLLSDVIASTYRAFPLLEIARLQAGVASGQQTSALGAYDTKLEYYTLNQPVGFYETYRSGIGVARQLWWGGYASAGYRIGRGNFEPWYRERQTNGGGEFKIALVQPLLQGRAIDPNRVELFQSNLRRQSVEPEIQNQVLIAGKEAAIGYWNWVEIGNVLKAQERLLEIAVKRGENLELAYAKKLSTQLDLAQNGQRITERRIKVNDSRQKFRDTAFKLSMFLRNEVGEPMLVPPEWLPEDFPEISTMEVGDFEQDLQTAMLARPELKLINIDLQSTRWDLSLARNQLLPNVDFTLQTAQNVGQGTSSINDKGEFQLESGIVGGVPIQRRKASGKIQSSETKLAQISQKFVFQKNKIGIELQTARNALDIAQLNLVQAREQLKLANDTLDLFRLEFNAGRRDLFFLLEQEVKVNDSEIKLLDVERDFYIALASLQAALGLDPLEQSTILNTDDR